MTEVLNKTDSPNIQTFSSVDDQEIEYENEKKQKIVYTSDFLKKFDKNKTKEFSSNIMQSQPGNLSAGGPIGTNMPIGSDPYGMDLDKDRQILEYRNIIQRLKSIISSSKDESLLNMMKVVLSDSFIGKSFLNDDIGMGKRMTPDIGGPIQNFVFLGDVEPSQVSVTPLNSFFTTHAANTSISGSLPPLRSPRKVESIPTIPVLPLSSQNGSTPASSAIPPLPTQTSFKSPRKQPSSSNLGSIIPPGLESHSRESNSISNIFQSSSTIGGLTSGGSKMKKSPSMPVIAAKSGNNGKDVGFDQSKSNSTKATAATTASSTNNNSNNNSNNTINNNTLTSSLNNNNNNNNNTTSILKSNQIPLNSLKKDSDIFGSSHNIGAVGGNKKSTDHQPRKPMTKSVSMSAIGANNLNDPNNPIKCTSLEEIAGQIYHLTKYQAGCRFLQKKLEEKPDAEHVTLIFKEVFDHLIELMVDPYGQYLIPQLMKYCDNNQRRQIVDKIAPKVETFACHVYGIHGIQKVLQFLSPDQVESIIQSIKGKVIQLSKDNKGNYLIQSFLKQFSPEVNQFICDAIMDNIVEICTHKVGCTVVNRCIDNANPEQLEKLVDRITDHSLALVQDQFGNYVVQHLLSNNKSYSNKLIKSLLGNIAELSVQKFSSNVIEKCLQVADTETYENIIKEITEADILNLLQDKYANFVIQTALDVADENQHAKLVKIIVPYIHQIKTPYVIHIQKKILQV
ncbi:hypothetical protein CYY_008215 [Polysphondylium violaceum]|uniref:PUM-HD domain-containing protein n=1 Tax=Polysphondylium violaceum TaxID=133409 RepID=A0A8J4PNL7_9MYCE|nr:hypothetical protein CYY_008215 [Polysphondylium violaceum]